MRLMMKDKHAEWDGKNDSSLVEDLEARLDILEENSDRFFLVIMAILIFLMHVGFGFLEAGSTRQSII
jgi:hypothetical protein